MAGTTINPYRFGGQVGYRRDSPTRQYVRARHLDMTNGRWISRDPMAVADSDQNFYWYVKNNPVNNLDPTGLKSVPVSCQQIVDCLGKNRPQCTPKGKFESSPGLMLCTFWQESTWGQNNPQSSREGPGNCTHTGCFEVLKGRDGEFRHVKCPYLDKYKTWADFTTKATQCEKMWAAQDIMAYKGLHRFGPPYPSQTEKAIKQCANCITDFGGKCHSYWDFVHIVSSGAYPCGIIEPCIHKIHR